MYTYSCIIIYVYIFSWSGMRPRRYPARHRTPKPLTGCARGRGRSQPTAGCRRNQQSPQGPSPRRQHLCCLRCWGVPLPAAPCGPKTLCLGTAARCSAKLGCGVPCVPGITVVWTWWASQTLSTQVLGHCGCLPLPSLVSPACRAFDVPGHLALSLTTLSAEYAAHLVQTISMHSLSPFIANTDIRCPAAMAMPMAPGPALGWPLQFAVG